ncbi:ATP-dependent DNA helicase RecQ [Zhouia sp. PK063]|uniref:ATP-dependent DNA helicase RecQ n=1 Tax=Zhouia sp. PK063 TaxID=3373602 RepID=UPI0037B092CB
MPNTPLEILQKYWGFDTFRSPQEDIITSVLHAKDTLALLPTGGGKSLCFQIPAMVKPGICVVVSPLIALIKDQVARLKQQNIKAIALTSGIKYYELDALLDNCIYGDYKFLYLSPERLQQDIVQERLKQMPVNLIAIDEAHCISQWGNDFRPSYLQCTILRSIFPEVPVIALTASATPKVQEDIITHLALKEPQVFKKSFARENIAYMVFETEDKLFKLQQILKKNPQSSIVYVRNRKATVQTATTLQQQGLTATYFHGGISTEEKQKRLQQWLANEVQVMVATNAFGMGIDKPDVKTVIHLTLPDCIENYYQEAGRAGRNGEKSFAVLLKDTADETLLKNQFLKVLPEISFLKTLYKKLNNYFQISFGEGQQETFAFNFNEFCATYQFQQGLAYNALKILDRNGIISLTQNFERKTTVQFLVGHHKLFQYLDRNYLLENITQTILRTYGGIFDTAITINTELIAKKAGTPHQKVLHQLQQLATDEIISYHYQHTDAEITFLVPREDDATIHVIAKEVQQQQKLKEQQIAQLLKYTENNTICKSIQLLTYFGEKQSKPCGICSVCIEKKSKLSKEIVQLIKEDIINILSKSPVSSKELSTVLSYKDEHLLVVIQILLEEEKISINSKNEYQIIAK